MKSLSIRLLISVAMLFTLAGPAARTTAAPALPATVSARPAGGDAAVRQLIVRIRTGALAGTVNAQTLSAAAGVALVYARTMFNGAQVLRLPAAVPASEARRLAAVLAAQPGVAYAVPDYVRAPLAAPNDPAYPGTGVGSQWNLHEYTGSLGSASAGGINAPAAWDLITDTTSVVVAVLDTGVLTDHPDLPAGWILPGYDFVTDSFTANDGDARDSDARDPGDWVLQADIDNPLRAHDCGQLADPTASSWHGTGVAGLIAAQGNNSQGIAGVAWGGARILPVRVLGKCGGVDSDIVDGMLWAAGLPISGPAVPVNPQPAQILNLSLGAASPCTQIYSDAIDALTAAGKVIIAAAGNDQSSVNAPANCAGVLAVGANNQAGALSNFSSFGPETALLAPGGQSSVIPIVSLSNTGATVAVAAAPAYSYTIGTSDSAPQVAGVAALLFAANPALTGVQVSGLLTTTARAFPAGTNCLTTYLGQCGAGILDAGAAVSATLPVITALSPVSVTVGGADFLLTITGYNFVTGAQVLWNGAPLAANFVNTTTLTVTIPAANVAAGGAMAVRAANPGAGVGPVLRSFTAAAFTVVDPNATPTPVTPTPVTPTPVTPTPPQISIFLPTIQRGP